ncbi:MAG: hypothetical protein Q4C30_08555 [Bacteroidia bacterium]|nr:hypothetical protein [Bacteroidia bacterium]
MRLYQNITKTNESIIRDALETIADKYTNVFDYRNAFKTLGIELGRLVGRNIKLKAEEIMLVCASEDADWLATGVEEGLGIGDTCLSVYWSGRSEVYRDNEGTLEISPIIKSYEEPIKDCKLLVIVESIISSSCVVKTQLNRLIGKMNPEKIAILAPVMYKDGIPNLRSEFPKTISNKFKFYTFAIDDEKNEKGEVVPGIGGMVYTRLGLGTAKEKNLYIPKMVIHRC